jgi:Zn-dependent protease
MSNVYSMRRSARRPSLVFLGIVVVFAATGVLIWRSTGDALPSRGVRFAVFVFVLSGWLISLCLHEYGHAYLAWRSGDKSVAAKGYLTLNPLKYADLGLSIILPFLFVLLGGIGLPGGAVWIERGSIPGRWRHSLISAAGPAMNLIFAVGLGITVSKLWDVTHLAFWSALAYLAFLQVTATILNLIPLPGLDGLGIWEPFLPRTFVQSVARYGAYAFMVLILLLWIPTFNHGFFNLIYHVTDALGINQGLIGAGLTLFRFWSS